jgi:hypothetical protein
MPEEQASIDLLQWAVICGAVRRHHGLVSDWDLATQVFPSQHHARGYAAGISPSRRPTIVLGDWRVVRAHLPGVVFVTFIERPDDVTIGTARLLPLDTTRKLHSVRGRFSQLRLPGDGTLPGEPLPSLDADPSIWVI